MVSTYVISLTLLGLSGILLDAHRRAWAAARRTTNVSESNLRYARALYRRRMQASGIIGAMGAAIGVWPLVPQSPVPVAAFMLLLVSACGWIVLLALADAWATRQHYRRIRDENLAAQLRLALEFKSAHQSADADR